jgi:hypothetical protein
MRHLHRTVEQSYLQYKNRKRDEVHPDLRSGQVMPFVPQGDAANKCDATEDQSVLQMPGT